MTQAERPTSLAALRARYGVRYRWLLLLAVMVGTMASIMSSTIVNVAIPDMSQHFALGQERAQWVTSGFMVAMTVSMLTTPWLLARYGYRHTYVGLHGAAAGRRRGRRLCQRLRPGAGGARGRRAGRGRGAADPGHHHPARLRARTSRGAPAASSAWAWCWRRPSAPASAACWWTGSAGDRSSSWWCRSAWPRCGWPTQFVPVTAPGGVAANRDGAALDWLGLLLASAGTLCLLNGLVELRGGTAAVRRRTAGRRAGGAVLAFIALAAPPVAAEAAQRPRAADEPARCSPTGLRHGRHRGLHLRHGAVRLHLPAAGVHADGAEALAVLRGHHPAAGRSCIWR